MSAALHSGVSDLDKLIADGHDGTTHYANTVLRELVEMQFAILTKQIPMSNDDLRERVVSAQAQGIAVKQFEWLL